MGGGHEGTGRVMDQHRVHAPSHHGETGAHRIDPLRPALDHPQARQAGEQHLGVDYVLLSDHDDQLGRAGRSQRFGRPQHHGTPVQVAPLLGHVAPGATAHAGGHNHG